MSTTVVIQQSFPGAAAGAVTLLEGQLGSVLEARETITTPVLEWTLYQASIPVLVVDIAIADDDTRASILLLQATETDRDTAYETIFLPILNTLTPPQ